MKGNGHQLQTTLCRNKQLRERENLFKKMVGIKRTKKAAAIVSDEYVPSSDNESESSGNEGSEEEEENSEEEDDEEAAHRPTPPPSAATKKVKTSAAAADAVAARPKATPRKRSSKVLEEGDEDDEEEEGAGDEGWVVAKKYRKATKGEGVGRKRKKTEKTVPSVTLAKKSKTDYEVQLDPTSKITDMSLSTPKYPNNKIILDERYWVRVGSVSYKGKGITFEQLFIGRDPAKGDVNKDGSLPKPFQMGLPLRCLEPLRRAVNFLTGNNADAKTPSVTVL